MGIKVRVAKALNRNPIAGRAYQRSHAYNSKQQAQQQYSHPASAFTQTVHDSSSISLGTLKPAYNTADPVSALTRST